MLLRVNIAADAHAPQNLTRCSTHSFITTPPSPPPCNFTRVSAAKEVEATEMACHLLPFSCPPLHPIARRPSPTPPPPAHNDIDITSTLTKKKKLHPLVSAVAKCFQLETLEIALCWLLPPIVARSRDGRWHLRPTTTQPRNTSPSIHLHSTAQHSSNSNDGSVGSGNMGTYATNQTRQTDRRTRRMRLALFSTPQSVSQSRLNVCTFVYMYVRGWHEVAKPSTLPRYVCSHLTAAAAAAAAAVLEVPPSWF
ncbi:hypothetical protein IWX47DRAFT_293714 [Phyllosticta citricarpa]|uniref:Uncharacterized protein n=1 Tax=Phyllosticta citricarpa TaxID=55181 RepID=A0ABR1M0K4_9PEZI